MPVYSLSTPGSMSMAWPRMRMADEPTSQKKTEKGDAMKSIGRPMTKRAMYMVFWVMTVLPTSSGSGPVRDNDNNKCWDGVRGNVAVGVWGGVAKWRCSQSTRKRTEK